MKIRTAHLVYQYDEVRVEIRDMPLRAWLIPQIMDIVCYRVFRGRLCAPWEWTYNIRWGPADEHGIADKSIGHLWFTFGQKTHLACWEHGKMVASIPVTHQWVRENWEENEPADSVDSAADAG